MGVSVWCLNGGCGSLLDFLLHDGSNGVHVKNPLPVLHAALAHPALNLSRVVKLEARSHKQVLSLVLGGNGLDNDSVRVGLDLLACHVSSSVNGPEEQVHSKASSSVLSHDSPGGDVDSLVLNGELVVVVLILLVNLIGNSQQTDSNHSAVEQVSLGVGLGNQHIRHHGALGVSNQLVGGSTGKRESGDGDGTHENQELAKVLHGVVEDSNQNIQRQQGTQSVVVEDDSAVSPVSSLGQSVGDQLETTDNVLRCGGDGNLLKSAGCFSSRVSRLLLDRSLGGHRHVLDVNGLGVVLSISDLRFF